MQGDSRVTSNPPAVTVTEITEPTAVNAGIELIAQDAVQLQSMPLRARRIIVRLPEATVVQYSTNRRVRTRTRVLEGLIAYVVFGPQANGTVNGVPVRPGMMLAVASETEATFVVEQGWESITFLVSPTVVRAHLAVRGRDADFHMPHGVEPLQADTDGARRLFSWAKRLTTTAARQPDIFNDGQNERVAAQVELFETLLPVLGSRRTSRAHPQRPHAAGAQRRRGPRRSARHVACR